MGIAGLALFASVVAAGCGSRGPLDLEGAGQEDSGADADVPDVEPIVDATPTPKDTGPEAGTGLVDCGLCIANKCGGAILACITKPDCQKILTCVTQTCLAGGGLNPICMLTCVQTAPAGAADAIQVVTCLTQTCGPTCIDVLSGLGGLGGGGGGGTTDAGRTDAGRADAGRDASIDASGNLTLGDPRASVNYLFSPWPVLTCPAEQP
ncbi:MAG: hypothetical protein JWM74_1160 [Myxococcaceae bacterium]|nr:hypothetical protein [Myxococcaceae bacterium]